MLNSNKRVAKCHPITEAANIFVPIKKGKRKRAKTVVWESDNNNNKIEIWMFEELDIVDQDLFLTILSLLAEYDKGSVIDITNDNNCEILNNLFNNNNNNRDDSAVLLDTLQLTVTRYELLKTMNKDDNTLNYKLLESSLDRLSRCGLKFKTNDKKGSSSLLAYTINDNDTINIAINPLTSMVYIHNDIRYIQHDISDRMTLNQLSKAIHSYFSRLINNRQSRALKYETITARVYSEDKPSRYKISRVKKELKTFKSNNFKITPALGNKCVIVSRINNSTNELLPE